MILILFFVLFCFFAFLAEKMSDDYKSLSLLFVCIIFAIIAGIRDESWSDTGAYLINFMDYTPSFRDLTPINKPYGYTEKGFYYLGVLVKSFTIDSTIYFLFISFLTFYFLYKTFCQYCIYPFWGICVYISRFYLLRDFQQIRAGLAYAIVVFGTKYITNRDWKRYFILVFISSLFHKSTLIAIPLYFICMINVKKIHIIIGIVLAFVISINYSDIIMTFINNNASDMMIETYTGEKFIREYGLSNPMIYYQLFLLMAYTFAENRMKLTTEHYYTIRNAYFYSTFFLIALSCYTALSGRTSSLFATLEVVIIPSLVFSFYKNIRWVAYLGIALALSVIFYLNMMRV